MPIKSYLAHPHQGQKEELMAAISKMQECDVIPAKNEEILIVVTDTESNEGEENLKIKLESITSLKLLAMVSGFNTAKEN
jgi:nitrate reductase NapAB chaperone NapD